MSTWEKKSHVDMGKSHVNMGFFQNAMLGKKSLVNMGFFQNAMSGKKSHVDMGFLIFSMSTWGKSHVNWEKIPCQHGIFFPTWHFEKIPCQHGAPFPDDWGGGGDAFDSFV
jgi:hypothetical protein